MEKMKISAIKQLDSIRKEILNSDIKELPQKFSLLEDAYQIGLKAPIRVITRLDGIKINNQIERNHILSMLKHEIEYIQSGDFGNFDFLQFQVVSTLVMLMISISDEGLAEIDDILKK